MFGSNEIHIAIPSEAIKLVTFSSDIHDAKLRYFAGNKSHPLYAVRIKDKI
jgi:hypothetical protein